MGMNRNSPNYQRQSVHGMNNGYDMNYHNDGSMGVSNRPARPQKQYRQNKDRGGANRQNRPGNRQNHDNTNYGEMAEGKPRRTGKQNGEGAYRNYANKGYQQQGQSQGKYYNRYKPADTFSDASRRDNGNRARQRDGNGQQRDFY